MADSGERPKGPGAGAEAPADPGKERVPFSTRSFYGLGSISEGIKDAAFKVFLLFYYNQVLGLPGSLGGLAILLALVVDAITDPLMGSISDNFHSRWGRRHPFMYAAPLPMAACFFLLFNPPASLGETQIFLWLTSFAVLVRVSMTLYSIPSNSMVAEMTPHYDDPMSEQSRAGEAMLRNAESALETCRQVHRATEEQKESGRFITTSIGSVTEMIRSIQRADRGFWSVFCVR